MSLIYLGADDDLDTNWGALFLLELDLKKEKKGRGIIN